MCVCVFEFECAWFECGCVCVRGYLNIFFTYRYFVYFIDTVLSTGPSRCICTVRPSSYVEPRWVILLWENLYIHFYTMYVYIYLKVLCSYLVNTIFKIALLRYLSEFRFQVLTAITSSLT